MSKPTKTTAAYDGPVTPRLTPAKPISSNDVDVIRGVRPSKYAGLDRKTRVSFRAAAKAAGLSVEQWMAKTGNDNVSRGATPVLPEAIVARHLGVRHGNLTAYVAPSHMPCRAWVEIATAISDVAESLHGLSL